MIVQVTVGVCDDIDLHFDNLNGSLDSDNTSSLAVKTSVSVTTNSPFQDYTPGRSCFIGLLFSYRSLSTH